MLKVVFMLCGLLCLTLADPMDEKVLERHARSLGSDSDSHEPFPNLQIPANTPYSQLMKDFIAFFLKLQATLPPAAVTTTAAATPSTTAASTTATAKAATT